MNFLTETGFVETYWIFNTLGHCNLGFLDWSLLNTK